MHMMSKGHKMSPIAVEMTRERMPFLLTSISPESHKQTLQYGAGCLPVASASSLTSTAFFPPPSLMVDGFLTVSRALSRIHRIARPVSFLP
jgi:hypothetical protein